MNAEKHVLPILTIVLVLVALVCTYAWFTQGSDRIAKLSINSGTPTSFSISENQGATGDNQFAIDSMYSGQRGYRSDGTPYADDDAPFYVFKTISYEMSGQSNIVIDVSLDKLIVHTGDLYLYSFNETLKLVMGLTDEQIAALTETTKLNYYVEYTNAMESDVNAITAPTGANPNPIYMVYNSTTSKVVYLVFGKSVVDSYMTLDYWVSNAEDNEGLGVLPTDTHTSKKATGISLQYIEDGGSYDAQNYDGAVCNSGFVNYFGVYIGFYGWDSVNNKGITCLFSDAKFQGSSFYFQLSAGGM